MLRSTASREIAELHFRTFRRIQARAKPTTELACAPLAAAEARRFFEVETARGEEAAPGPRPLHAAEEGRGQFLGMEAACGKAELEITMITAYCNRHHPRRNCRWFGHLRSVLLLTVNHYCFLLVFTLVTAHT